MSNFINILACSADGSNCCSDYKLANVLDILNKTLKLFQLAIPIILMVFVVIQLVKLVANPDDEDAKKGIFNKIMGMVIFFILPMIVNVLFGLVPSKMELSACWKQASSSKVALTSNNNGSSSSSSNNKSTKKQKKNTKKQTKTTKKKKQNKRKKVQVKPTKKKSKTNKKSMQSTKKLLALNKKEKKKLRSSIAKTNGSKSKSKSGSKSSAVSGKVTGSAKGKKIVKYASKFLGNSYCMGGKNPHKCADCSGFVAYVFNHFGFGIISQSSAMWGQTGKYTKVSTKDIRKGKLKAGDIIVYEPSGGTGHVAIATGKGEQIIHASDPKSGIKLSDTYKYRAIRGVMRVKGVN